MRTKTKMRVELMEERRNHRRLRRVRTLAIAAAVEAVGSVLVPRAMGQVDTWNGASDNTWLNSSNWTGAHAPPQSGDALVFNGTNTQGNLSLNNNLTSLSFTVAGITFSSGSAAYVIGDGTATDTNAGNAFTLTSGITNSSTAAITINDPITLSGNQSFYAATAAGTLTLGGNITGSGVTLTTNGGTGGAQVASNTFFTGAVSLGALLAQGNSNDGSTYSSNPTTTFNNANLTVTGNVSVGRSNLVFAGNTTANIAGTLGTVGAASADWANITIQGSANVSAGSLNMTGSAATGQFTLNGGNLTTGSISAIDSTSGGYIVHNVLNGTQIIASQSNSSFLTITKSSAFSGSNEVFVGNNGALFNTNGFNIATNTTLQNDTGATGFLTKTGSGTLTLTAAEAYTGVTTVSAGTLQIGDGTSGHDGSIAGASIVDNSVLAYDTNANQAYSGVISGNGSLNKIGAGVLVLSGSNSYSGGTNISAGTLRVQAPIAQVTSGSQLYLNAASLTGTANGATVTTWTDLSGNGRNTSAGTGTVTFQSTGVHGNPTVVFNGSSVLNDALSASNTTGTIFIVEQTGNTTNPNGAFFGSNGAGGQEFRQAGTQLQFLSRGVAPLGNTSSGTLTTSGQILAVTFTTGANGTQFYVNGSSVGTTQNGNVSFNSGLTSQIGGSQAFNGGYEDFIGNISAVVVYNTVLTSSQITATTNALNSEFFGSGSGNQLLPSGGPVTLSASGASLDLNGWNQSIGSLSGVAGSTITLGNAVLTVNPNGASTVFAGNISDSGGASSSTGGALSLAGTGTLILAGSNSYTGATTIGSGTTLQLGNGTSDGIIASTSGVTDNGALVYNLLASRSASYAITGNGSVTVNDTGATQGAISLTSSSSYTGATLVSVGTLTVDHSSGHTGALGNTAITVSSTGTLAVKGATTIGSGGLTNNGGVVNLADGTIASVTEGGNLTFSNGTLNEDILTGGTSDTLVISGNANISGNNTIILSGTLGVHTYTLVTAAGGLGSGFVIGSRPSGFFTLSLGNSTSTQEILTVTGTPASPTEYWTGAASASGAPSQSIAPDTNNNWGFGSTFNTAKSNWSTDAAGANDALQVPGPSTDVVFTAGNATSVSGAINTQLDATYSIKGITFDTSSVTSQTSATGPISSVGINTNGFTLTIGADGLTVGVNDNSSTTLSGNGAVLLNGNQTWANNSGNPLAVSAPITGQSASGTNTLSFNGSGSGNVTLSGVISDGTSGGNLGLVVAKSGTGLLALNGNNTFTGGLTLSSGIVQLGNPGALNSTTPNAVTFSSGSTGDLQLNGNSITVPSLNSSGGTPIIEDASATATAATLTANIASGTSTYGGVLQDGSGGGILSLTKSGSGTLVLSGTSSTYTGVTDFSAGITNVASLANYGVASSIGARTAGQETAVGSGIGILIDGGTLQYTGSGNQSTNRQIRLGPGTNTIDSSGTGTLSFTYNGTNTNLFETTTSPNLTLTGNNTGANTFAINLTNGVSVVKTGVGYWNLSGNDSSTNGITISAGTLALSGSNSYTGALAVRDGTTLQLQANAANTNGANISYAIGSPGSFAFSQGSGSSSATMQLRGDSSVTFANTTPSSGTGGTTLYYDVNNFGGADATTGQTFTVGGYATYQTTINVSGGHGYALTLGNITNANSNYLNVNANMANLNMGSISGLNGATLTVGGASNTNILGVISSGAVTKMGTGALTLSASNTYTGNTLVTGGTLVVPSSGSIVGSGLSINDNNVAGNYTGVIYTAGTIATTGDILTARGQNAGSNVTGIIYQTGGSVSDGSTNDVYVALGSGTGGSTVNGTYNISGGSLTPGRQLFLGGYNSSLSSNTTAALNINGGNVTATAYGVYSFQNSAATGTVNLNAGGLLKTNAWYNANTAAGGATTLNFNGGTLQANAASTNFLDTSTTAVNVYTGGGTIDTQTNNITITQAISSAANSGLTAVSLTDSTDTFAAPTAVTFTGITSGAAPTGYTVLNASGQVTGVVITNAGSFTGNVTGATIAGANPVNVSFGNATTAANNLGGLTKVGAGTLTLTASSSFAGPTMISAGTLTIDHSGTNTGSLASSVVTVFSGTTLNVKGSSSLGGLNDNGNVSLADGPIGNVTVNGTLSFNSGGLSEDVSSNGTSDVLVATGAASISGSNTINLSGSLATGNYTLITATSGLGSGFSIGSKPTGFYSASLSNSTATAEILTVNANATPAVAYWSGAASFANGDAADNWGNGTSSSNWSSTSDGGNDTLQVPGASTTVYFTAANAFTNNSSNPALTTQLDGAYSIQGLVFDTSPTGGSLTSVTINTNANTLTIGNGGLTVASTANNNSSATISGNGSILLNGSQAWANNSGNLLTIGVPVAGNAGNATTNTLMFNGSGSGNVALGGVISNGTGGGNLALIVSKTGSGVLGLNAANTFTGGVTLNSGTVQLGNAGALNSTTPNSVTFGGNSTGDLQLNGNSVTVAGLISTDTSTTAIVEDAAAGNATLTNNITGNVTYGGVLQDGTGGGKLALLETGAGTFTLTGASNTYSGGTTIGAGQAAAVVRAAATQALGSGTIAFDGAGNGSPARLELIGNISLNNAISLAARNNSSVAIENIGGSNTLSGSITGGIGGGSYTIQSDAGLLSLTNATAITIPSGSRTLFLQGAGNGSISGAISGNTSGTSLVKSGSGAWTLNGASTFAGTTVSGGTLFANNSSSSLGTGAVNVNGGLLAGSGTINNGSNALAVNSGGTIGAGATASATGILTSGVQTWNGHGTYAWKITGTAGVSGVAAGSGASGMIGNPGNGSAGTEGGDWDNLVMSALTVNATTGSPFTIFASGTPSNSSGSSYSWVIAQTGNASLPSGIADSGNLLAGGNSADAGEFALNTANLTLGGVTDPSPSAFSLEFDPIGTGGNYDLVLDYSYSAAPEPGTGMLVLGGILPALMARRRRRNKTKSV